MKSNLYHIIVSFKILQLNSTLFDTFEVQVFLLFVTVSSENISIIHTLYLPFSPCSNQIVFQFYTFENIKSILNNSATKI